MLIFFISFQTRAMSSGAERGVVSAMTVSC
jgi:hypothetical protein